MTGYCIGQLQQRNGDKAVSCQICEKPVAGYNNEGHAEICYACRDSQEQIPLWVRFIKGGAVHLGFAVETDDEKDPVERVIETRMRKCDVAVLRDIAHGAAYLDGREGARMTQYDMLVTDIIPSLVADVIRSQK